MYGNGLIICIHITKVLFQCFTPTRAANQAYTKSALKVNNCLQHVPNLVQAKAKADKIRNGHCKCTKYTFTVNNVWHSLSAIFVGCASLDIGGFQYVL